MNKRKQFEKLRLKRSLKIKKNMPEEETKTPEAENPDQEEKENIETPPSQEE